MPLEINTIIKPYRWQEMDVSKPRTYALKYSLVGLLLIVTNLYQNAPDEFDFTVCCLQTIKHQTKSANSWCKRAQRS